jgi:pentapeptide MXKDX repeat protein
MKMRILFAAAIAAGLASAPAAFAQDAMKKDGMTKSEMSKESMPKSDKMNKMDTKDGTKKTDAMGSGDKMKKDEMKK